MCDGVVSVVIVIPYVMGVIATKLIRQLAIVHTYNSLLR